MGKIKEKLTKFFYGRNGVDALYHFMMFFSIPLSLTGIHITRLAPILPPPVLLHHISFPHQFINRPLDRGNTALVVQRNRPVRGETVFMLTLSVVQISVDRHRLG